MVTRCKTTHAGTQVAQRDFQNNSRSRWTGTTCFARGSLRDLVTWCKITYVGEQVAQWDFQKKRQVHCFGSPTVQLAQRHIGLFQAFAYPRHPGGVCLNMVNGIRFKRVVSILLVKAL